MTSPASQIPIDLDQVASEVIGLRPSWISQGLAVGPVTWRDARASWPQPIVTDRNLVSEPESVGITVTAADGRKGHLVIWRGGWADVDVLADGRVTSRNPAIHHLADCVAEAKSMVDQLTAAAARTKHSEEAVTDDLAARSRWILEIWPDDAIVLFDWLMTVDFDQLPIQHKAQKQALADLLTVLETQAPVAGLTQAQIDHAQYAVSKGMGWQ